MSGRAFLRRLLKAMHEVAAIGIGGGLAACLAVGMTASPVDFAASRLAIGAIARFVLLPSLIVVLVTGLLAMAVTRAYQDAGWAWLKALLGLSVFEATLLTIGSSSRPAEILAATADSALLASLLQSERNTLWLLIVLSVANVVLAVWRPRLVPKVR